MAEIYTVGCRLDRLVPDAQHLNAIRSAVERMQHIMVLVCDLLNLYVRDRLQNHRGTGLEHIFDRNWLFLACKEVTTGSGRETLDPNLTAIRLAHMADAARPSRQGLGQIMANQRTNLAATASTNIWLHFRKRLFKVVNTAMRTSAEEYALLTTEERLRRKLQIKSIVSDILRKPSEPYLSDEEYHALVDERRHLLGIDDAVGLWGDYPFAYHIKSHPERFVRATFLLSVEREQQQTRNGTTYGGFSLFPMRRTMVPRHIMLDQKALRELLGLGNSEHTKEKAREASKRKREEEKGGCPTEERKPRVRRKKDELVDEKRELFSQVLNLRSAQVAQRHRFAWSFTTDGVCARLHYERTRSTSSDTNLPRRGLWAIDEIKRRSRSLEELHVIGIDPGKREICVAVDTDNPLVEGRLRAARYTLQQRQRDQRLRQYADDMTRSRPTHVMEWQENLSGINSRTVQLERFGGYCSARRQGLEGVLGFYATLRFRQQRWKKYIKTQKSEEKFYRKLREMHDSSDGRQLTLAYGSWGLIAGRPGGVGNRGIPPTIGVGMMRKLSKRFLVVLTPEHHTSKTCCKCHGHMGPWQEVEEKMQRKIRGLRVCQNVTCRMPQNRDKAGALNIGENFKRIFDGRAALRECNAQEARLIELSSEIDVD